MQFLYPTSRQFPFDVICETIVRELEVRNWEVPGITVEFSEYGSGEQKFRHVQYIKGKDFKLWFCRKQCTMTDGRYNDIAAVTEIVIPKKEIRVYEDESGPTFYLYVGDNWARDREKFMNGSKVNSKLNGEPRMYLEYKGAWSNPARYIYPGQRPPLLVHNNDLGREYDPKDRGKWNWLTWRREPGDPTQFKTSEVMEEFTSYLEKEVLEKRILSQGIPTEKKDRFAAPTPVPFPQLAILGEVFCFGEYRDAERIKQGKTDPNQLPPAERFGMCGSGYRLMSLGTPNDGTVPEIAYDGFLWCGIASTLIEVPIDSLEVPGHYRWSDRERFVIRLKLNRANDVYIADHAEYEKRRKELGDAMEKGRDTFTDAEVADFTRARARTIIPLGEYKGGFGQPVILVNRELSFEEVEVVSGPHKDRRGY